MRLREAYVCFELRHGRLAVRSALSLRQCVGTKRLVVDGDVMLRLSDLCLCVCVVYVTLSLLFGVGGVGVGGIAMGEKEDAPVHAYICPRVHKNTTLIHTHASFVARDVSPCYASAK